MEEIAIDPTRAAQAAQKFTTEQLAHSIAAARLVVENADFAVYAKSNFRKRFAQEISQVALREACQKVLNALLAEAERRSRV